MKTITGTIDGRKFSLSENSENDGEYPTLQIEGSEFAVLRELAKRIIKNAALGESNVGEIERDSDLFDLFRDLGI
jgi:hypothetical protein